MGLQETVHAITNGDAVAFARSPGRYSGLDERYADGRAFVADVIGTGSGVLLDTTTLHIVQRLALDRDGAALIPATLLDLANFVTAVITYDHLFHLESDALAPDVINTLLGERVIVPLPLARFSEGVAMEAGVLADTWQDALVQCRELIGAQRRSRLLYDERAAALSGWSVVVGGPVTDGALFDEKHFASHYASDGEYLLERILDVETLELQTAIAMRVPQSRRAVAAIGGFIAECNARCYFNTTIGHFLGLHYVPNSYRLPFRTFLFDRARAVQPQLASLHLIEDEFARRVAEIRAVSEDRLVLPFFLASILADVRDLDEFWPVLASVRTHAAGFRRSRKELDQAILDEDARTVKLVRSAINEEAQRLRTMFGLGKVVAGATAAALAAVCSAPALLLVAAVGLLTGVSQIPTDQAARIARRVTQPEWWLLARQADMATSLLNAYPRIADLWALPAREQGQFHEHFERLGRL